MDDDVEDADTEAQAFGTTQVLIGGGVMVAAAGFVLAIAAEPRWMGPLLIVLGLAGVAAGAMRLVRGRRR
jgi:hypothetical protein